MRHVATQTLVQDEMKIRQSDDYFIEGSTSNEYGEEDIIPSAMDRIIYVRPKKRNTKHHSRHQLEIKFQQDRKSTRS